MSAAQTPPNEQLFLDDLLLTDLRFGASFLIWGFRHCAAGAADAPAARRSYEVAFEGNAQALVQLELLTTALNESGHRKIWYAPPNCSRLTHDEARLLEVLEAAQTSQHGRLADGLCALLDGAPSNLVCRCARTLAQMFRQQGYYITAPCQAPSSAPASRDTPITATSDMIH